MPKIDKQETIRQLNLSVPVSKTEIKVHERLKELRKQNNLSQKEMAEHLTTIKDGEPKTLPYMTYVAYEQNPSSDNHRLPPLDILMQLSDLFKVSTDWLLGVTEYPFREGHSVDFSSLLYFSKNLTDTEKGILELLLNKMNPQ